ncbi:uncharacterized protein HMPREF1120_06657 [Exophiala dermatitidis NIH/UT8656]|uniref:Uncharacterized protein n=1 Tax=Exophiala dermatitidis (strain ATCC 34100 / CBS 525.76 / NIH/UT8656) TaxID=858893 RepID=H6C1W6_EXODN|nr:uncharacterized protein HMPREF1120_06657 [Exophiala dermatitidis NIH/UT8656]EHY58653.1 hypothetical protein HMPREF1120_06657 [Exophiala dermatitidis NIH/UT8656]
MLVATVISRVTVVVVVVPVLLGLSHSTEHSLKLGLGLRVGESRRVQHVQRTHASTVDFTIAAGDASVRAIFVLRNVVFLSISISCIRRTIDGNFGDVAENTTSCRLSQNAVFQVVRGDLRSSGAIDVLCNFCQPRCRSEQRLRPVRWVG